MRYRVLRKSGLRVSELCLGAMTFGEEWGWDSSKDESRSVYDAFVEAGGNFIDTANVYTGGTSGRLMADDIDRIQPDRANPGERSPADGEGTGGERDGVSTARFDNSHVGARKLSRFMDNLGCLDVRLDPHHRDWLDDVSRIQLGTPHDLFTIDLVRSLAAGGMRDLIDA